ncbi:hypothetical protein EVAR_47439_1 [Eumeta japonica]|uniref:Uncharacterized protein n=1 Tax=Eumeta variegata TaxID=151549 RepID=A0A4C1XA60_EUMVA|nr:hypothetical protein EVAR_47439_1 [Eumeta japonica]
MMERFAGGDSNAVYGMVIRDEDWIDCYDSETKRQSTCGFKELPTKSSDMRSVSLRNKLLKLTIIYSRTAKAPRVSGSKAAAAAAVASGTSEVARNDATDCGFCSCWSHQRGCRGQAA